MIKNAIFKRLDEEYGVNNNDGNDSPLIAE